jgi:hypothetical protein
MFLSPEGHATRRRGVNAHGTVGLTGDTNEVIWVHAPPVDGIGISHISQISRTLRNQRNGDISAVPPRTWRWALPLRDTDEVLEPISSLALSFDANPMPISFRSSKARIRESGRRA